MRIRDWSSDVCSSDLVLGILSSQIHVAWALAAGGRLGVGNDPFYVKTTCFDPFPFPDPPEALNARIRDLGERLDAQPKAVLAKPERLTTTRPYNVLETGREGGATPDAEQEDYDAG